MDEVLFLAHRLPFPPDRGDKIRSHHILRAIARLHPVHVACFADDEFDMAEEYELSSLAASYCLAIRNKPLPIAGLEAMAKGQPVSVAAFHDRRIGDYVAEVLRTRRISAIYVFSGQMGQYVPADFRGRVIMDFVDVDSAKFDAYSTQSGWPMRWVHAREGQMMRAEEARLAMRADASLLISREEADLFRSRLTPAELSRTNLRVLGNGIDSVGFDATIVAPEPRLLDCLGPRLIFTGQMDYAPNIRAALRVMDAILPKVRAFFPDASFHVVGRNPPAELLARDGEPGCHVWGRVDDIRHWLKAADLALVPLDIARGVQNKVLEAMAMSLPVVLTSGAATGIGAKHGHEFRIADGDQALADAVINLLANRSQAAAMGQAARRFVVENASWQAALADLPALIAGESGTVRDAA